MASEVQICNLALSHLGESNQIASISPPDGSVNAGLCEQFYGIARTELLETGNWSFAIRRSTLAPTTNDSSGWLYAYAPPSNCLKILKVLAPGDREDGNGRDYEIRAGQIYTNVEGAVSLCVQNITDTTKFSPTFSAALGYMLAAYLAGPIVKGADGIRLGDALRERAAAMADRSLAIAANSRKVDAAYTPRGIAARR